MGWTVEHREATKKWLAQYLATYGERGDWVIDSLGIIKKATLTFIAKFLLMLVRHRLSPTHVDNVITWNRVVFAETLVAG